MSIDKRATDKWPIAPAIAAVLAHVLALRAGFVWLDHAHIERKLAIARPAALGELFTEGFAGTGYYRPLVAVTLSIDAVVGAPWFFHVTNLAWHAAAALAVAWAAEALGASARAARIAGVLFAVHPATAVVAGAIAFRSEAMIVVALLALVVAHRREKPLAAAAALLCGALTKETALVLGPLFVAALEVERRLATPARQVSMPTLAAEAAALGAALALRAAFAPAWRGAAPDLSLSEAIGTRLGSVARAGLAIGLPLDRSICDATRVVGIGSLAALGGALVLTALLWLAWRRRGVAWLLVLSILPLLQVVPVPRWWSLHYAYVPLAFASILVAERLARTERGRIAAIAGAAMLGAVSLLEGRRFASDDALWAPEIAADPACLEGQFYVAEVARERGDLQTATAHYEAALALQPRVLAYVDRAAAVQNLAATRLAAGDPAGALAALEAEIAREDARSEVLYLAAKAAHASGDRARARELIVRLQRRGWTGDPPPE